MGAPLAGGLPVSSLTSSPIGTGCGAHPIAWDGAHTVFSGPAGPAPPAAASRLAGEGSPSVPGGSQASSWGPAPCSPVCEEYGAGPGLGWK